MAVVGVLLVVALVILIGYGAARIFVATGVPDVPLLLALGLLLGPLNRVGVDHGLGIEALARALDPGTLAGFFPLVSVMALVVILFDSGMKLDFHDFGRSLRPALLHTAPIFLTTAAAIAAVCILVFGMPPMVAVVLAVALSNVGQTVSAAVLRQLPLDPRVRTVYFVEMALYDLISIPLLVSILEFSATGGADPGAFVRSFMQMLAVSLVLGGSAGLGWAWALGRLERRLAYMLTFAMLLLVYAVTAQLGGSGAVGVLLFGLVVGNRARIMPLSDGDDKGTHVELFHGEITFVVRTFFFLLLGATFSVTGSGTEALSTTGPLAGLAPQALFLVGVLLILVAIILARLVVVRLVSARSHPERRMLFPVFGRGLGTAVLAALPFLSDHYVPGTAYHDLFSPWRSVFIDAALLTVLLTVMASSLFVWRMHAPRPLRPQPATVR